MTAFFAFLGTICGAFLASIVNEMYKRHRDGISAAAAICGEISSYRESWKELRTGLPVLLGRVNEGKPLNIPDYGPGPDVTFDKYADKIGLLGAKHAEQITYIYGKARVFRAVVSSLGVGRPEKSPDYLASALQIGAESARICLAYSGTLIPELQLFAERRFRDHLWITIRSFLPDFARKGEIN